MAHRSSSARGSVTRTTVVVLTLLAVLLAAGCTRGGAVASDPPVGSSTGAALAPSSPTTSLATVSVSALPPQAVSTLRLVAAGGPFPYSQDGATFQNRERILPERPSGFYREYTVVTPGSGDRGPRRLVAGDDGSRFWTDDHYASFQEVVWP